MPRVLNVNDFLFGVTSELTTLMLFYVAITIVSMDRINQEVLKRLSRT